jgi:hypothetical protein
MSCSTAADEWWALLEKRESDILAMLRSFHPYYRQQPRMPVTAARAELVRVAAATEIAAKFEKDPAKRFAEYKAARDPAMWELMNEIWFGIPESTDAHYIAGFGALCELCSDPDALYPEGVQ